MPSNPNRKGGRKPAYALGALVDVYPGRARAKILRGLSRNHGHIGKTAAYLGVSYRWLWHWLELFKITKEMRNQMKAAHKHRFRLPPRPPEAPDGVQ
jgi:hypothetical protein